MRTSSIAAAFVASIGLGHANPLLPRAKCNADNCARAVTGTARPSRISIQQSDCSSFFRTTVTPPDVVTTITVDPPASTYTTVETTVTYTDPPQIYSTAVIIRPTEAPAAGVAARDVAPVTETATAVPAYASACSGTARYSSACSCAGVQHETVTVAADTYTTFVYGTSTPVVVRNVTDFVEVSNTEVYTTVGTYTADQPCGAILTYPGYAYNCRQKVLCGKITNGYPLRSYPARDEYTCGQLCAQDSQCVGAFFQFSTSYCVMFQTLYANATSDSSGADTLQVLQHDCQS